MRNSTHIVPLGALHLTNASLPSGSWSRGHSDVDVLLPAVQCAAALCRAPLSRRCATSACGSLLVSDAAAHQPDGLAILATAIGIKTILNSRSSVLAAANPHFGR